MSEQNPAADLSRYIDELKDRIDLGAVIGDDMTLNDAFGDNKVGLCPFHSERTESFFVYLDRQDGQQHYHCFGCGAHGDAITFVMERQRFSFWRALDELAALAHVAEYAGPRKEQIRRAEQKPRQSKKSDASASTHISGAAADVKSRRDDFMTRLALKIWRGAVPAGGTLADAYATARKIDVAALGGWPASLRFHSGLSLSFNPKDPAYREMRPAIVAGIQAPPGAENAGKVQAVHITYIAADGSDRYRGPLLKNGRRMFGTQAGCAIRLSPAAETMATSEGWENGLTVMAAYAKAGRSLSVWCGLSIGNIAGGGDRQKQKRERWHPKPLVNPKTGEWRRRRRLTEYPDLSKPGMILPPMPMAKTWIILGDSDSDRLDTEAQYKRATRRAQAQGRTVRIAWPPAGADFNDLATGKRKAAKAAESADASLRRESSAGA